MKRRTPPRNLVRSLLLAAGGLSMSLHARAGDLELDGHPFTLADGFSIERVVGPELVERPITANFDEKGRLYVSESSGTNDPVKQQVVDRPHRILRLEDTNNDGIFDKRIVYADQLMLPEGTLWHEGSLYVTAPPEIWKFTDTNDDGVADTREVWFDAKTLTGCANDLHGPYLGPEGYIYWTKGAFAEQTYERPGKPDFKTRAAHIFRRKADGTGPIEPVMTGGMDNPVDVVFSPEGERFFTTTFLITPGGGQRDGIIHNIYGGIYGKNNGVLRENSHVWTSPELMPVLVHLGPAAPSGLTRYESTAFGPEYQDNLFATCFNLHKVLRVQLTPKGSSYEATTEDLLSSPDVDFHPTDVIEDVDGSLLVVNTGGWYKLCCPTSQLHKPDVLGAIYRIKRVGSHKPIADPRGLEIDWDKLDPAQYVAMFADPRPIVQQRAIANLAKRDSPDILSILVYVLERGEQVPTRARMNAVWASSRAPNGIFAGDFLRLVLAEDANPGVRQAAFNALGTLKIQQVHEEAANSLVSASEFNRRGAAELLGMIGSGTDVPALRKALARDNDRALDHALTYALVSIADPGATAEGLSAEHPRVRRASMVALDQMGAADRLDPAQVAAWMSDPDAGLRASAAWVVGRHPEWGGSLASFFKSKLQQADLSPEARLALTQQLASLAAGEAIQDLLAAAAADLKHPNQPLVLQAMSTAQLKALPANWAKVLQTLLATAEPGQIDAAIAAIKGRELPEDHAPALVLQLNKLGDVANLPDFTRLAALAVIPQGIGEAQAERFNYLIGRLDPEQPVATRLTAADVLVKANLGPDQLKTLAGALKTAGPLELVRLLPAYQKSDDAAVGVALLDALAATENAKTLRAEQLDPVLKNFPDAVKAKAKAFIAANQVGLAEQEQRLDALIKNLPKGDVRRGHQVFASKKAACSTCHAMGYMGGRIGPDLTKIGQIRNDHDLIEAIVYPSSSFVRSYEPLTVSTLDGRIITGTIKNESTEELVLTLGADQEARIQRSEIEEIKPGTISIMPAGLDQQLTPEELADLLAFLKAAR